MTESTKPTSSEAQSAPVAATPQNISGRGVFVVETVAAGVAVRSAFLADDGRLIDIPAVFPDLMYAMAQIDELRQLVARRFAEAAQIGSQVIAQQIQSNRAQVQTQGQAQAQSETQSQTQSQSVSRAGMTAQADAQSESTPEKSKGGTISLSNGAAKSSGKEAKATSA